MTAGQITNDNFWNGYTMENYVKHDFFNTWAVNSIDAMNHWSKYLNTWANNFIEEFYNKPFPNSWDVKLVMSNEVSI